MARSIVCWVCFLALITAAIPAGAEQAGEAKSGLRNASSPNSSADDCEERMRELEASQDEGEERLAKKNNVIVHCASQYRRDKTIDRLVKGCTKYDEQPVVKQQAVAECQLAAFNYANALRTLKAGYRK